MAITTFANTTTQNLLTALDANFQTPVTIGSTQVGLGNSVASLTGLTNVATGNISVTTNAVVGNLAAVSNVTATIVNSPTILGVGGLGLFGDPTSGSAGLILATNGALSDNHYGAGTATFDSSGNITSVSDPSQKIITGPYSDGLEAVIAAATPDFMGWHKWRPESGMETAGTYASFFARDNFPIAGAVIKNEGKPNSFSDRAVIMALVNAVVELASKLAALEP